MRVLTLVAFAFLVGVVWWLALPRVDPHDLGPGARLVTRPGIELIVVGDTADHWRALPSDARTAADGYPLPEGLQGWPVIDSTGRVHALYDGGVVCLSDGAVEASRDLPVDTAHEGRSSKRRPLAEHELVLLGVDAADQPVLLWRGPDGPRVFVRGIDPPDWRLLETAESVARPPTGAVRGRVVLATGARALAFPGSDGWEAWLFDDDVVQRRVAEGCRGRQAVFSPDGEALVVDGKVKGLWRLELSDETLHFMADGNLGDSRRVPFKASFREPEPDQGHAAGAMIMVVPQRDVHDYLQIFQTHLTGGGRWRFSSGFTHHYAPAMSADGRHLAYVQADFMSDGNEAIREDLYLFDFQAPNASAIHLGSRPGGRSGQGPAFVGKGSVLVYIAGGRVQRLDATDT